MQVTERLFVNTVIYGRGQIEIKVIPQVVDADGRVVGARGMEGISATEAKAAGLATANGRDVWGNAEIEQIVLADTIMARPEIPAEPEQAAILDTDGVTVLRAAQPQKPSIPAVYRPRFGDITTVVWE